MAALLESMCVHLIIFICSVTGNPDQQWRQPIDPSALSALCLGQEGRRDQGLQFKVVVVVGQEDEAMSERVIKRNATSHW